MTNQEILESKNKITLTVGELGAIIGEALGYGSLCWKPEPTGEFLAKQAGKYLRDRIVSEMEKQKTKFAREILR